MHDFELEVGATRSQQIVIEASKQCIILVDTYQVGSFDLELGSFW